MDENQVRQIVQQMLDASKMEGLYNVVKVPFHTHNNLDSPPIVLPAMSTVLFDHYANAGNVTTGETTLYTDTITQNTLLNNGDKLDVQYGGAFVSSGTATREIKIYFAGTVIFDTGALTLSLSSDWTIYLTLIRVSSSVVRYMVSMTTEGAALAAYTNAGELTGLTLSAANILKITGQAAGVGAATNDIVAYMGYIEKKPAV